MAAATLEDLDGALSAVVFPRVFETTRALWVEDAILIVTGKVDMRDDRLQLIVETAELYDRDEPEQLAPAGASAPVAQPEPPTALTPTEVRSQLPVTTPPSESAPKAPEKPRKPAATPPPCVVTLTVETAGEPESDLKLLQAINDTLQARANGGAGKASVRIVTRGVVVECDLPIVGIKVDRQLTKQLTDLVGEGRLHLAEAGI